MTQDPSGQGTPTAVQGDPQQQWFPYEDDARPRRSWWRRSSPQYRTQVVNSPAPMSRVLSLIEPVVVMAFGALLGLMDQAATETSGLLRVPALIAALILVATAISDFQAKRQEWITADDLSEAAAAGKVVAVLDAGGALDTPGRAVHRSRPVAVKVTPVVQTAREDRRVIYFVMGLSVWLALATLGNPTAPWPLLVLSLLAAFLLFAEAWQLLRSRR